MDALGAAGRMRETEVTFIAIVDLLDTRHRTMAVRNCFISSIRSAVSMHTTWI